MTDQLRVGFIGVGMMGAPITRMILKAGFPLTVHDVRPEPVAELVSLGAKEGSTPAAVAATSDVVITSLPTLKAHEAVYYGENGLLSEPRKGTTYVETSTISPGTALRVADAAAKVGVAFLDAGLLSSSLPSDAKAAAPEEGTRESVLTGGMSTIMVGGDATELERIRPALAAFGDPVVHVGDVGSGMLIKVLNNAVVHSYYAVLCEMFATATAFGFDLDRLYEIFTHTNAKSSALTKQLGDFLKTGKGKGMSVEAALKDSAAMIELSEEFNLPMLMQSSTYAYYQMAMGAGETSKLPWNGEVARVFERFIGAPIHFGS